MDSENATKLDALGLTSLVLSALTLLTLGSIIFLYYDFIFITDWDFDSQELLFFVFSSLLSILTTIVAIIARKRCFAMQKKAANVCMIVGILGIIINSVYWLYYITYWWVGYL